MRDDAARQSGVRAPLMRSMPVFYINLAHRADRRARSEDLWRNQFRMQRVFRVPGVVDEPPFRGCTKAHLRAIEMVETEAPEDRYVILAEDDLVLLPGKTPEDVLQAVTGALRQFPDLNVLYLTASLNRFRRTSMRGIVKLKRKGALALPGMIVRRDYLPTLRRLLRKAQLKDTPHDKLICKVQGRHRWYLLWPHLMHQARDFSDIERRDVDYEYVDEHGRRVHVGEGGR